MIFQSILGLEALHKNWCSSPLDHLSPVNSSSQPRPGLTPAPVEWHASQGLDTLKAWWRCYPSRGWESHTSRRIDTNEQRSFDRRLAADTLSFRLETFSFSTGLAWFGVFPTLTATVHQVLLQLLKRPANSDLPWSSTMYLTKEKWKNTVSFRHRSGQPFQQQTLADMVGRCWECNETEYL